MSKTAVIYARYSSDRQREESIEGQIRECSAYAKRNDITILKIYSDRAMTGKTDRRPEFQMMIKDAAKQVFDYVLVYKLNRFARNRYDSAQYKHRLKKYGIKVISAMENIADDPSGILLESVIEGMAEYYSVELAENVMRGMTENALECKWPGGIVPLGYKLDENKHLIIDENKAFIVREIFQMALDGNRTASIVQELNNRHYLTAINKPFTNNSLTSILRNERYAGVFFWKNIRIEGGVPAIISKETFYAMQERLKLRKQLRIRICSDNYLLSGKLFCGNCGSKMIGMSGQSMNKESYYYYACASRRRQNKSCKTKNIRADKLEELICDTTIKILSDDEAIKLIAKQAVALQDKKQEDAIIDSIKEQIKDTSKKLKNCIQAVENGLVSDNIMKNIPEYEKRLEDLKKDLSEAELQKSAFKLDENMIRFFFHAVAHRIKKEDKFKSILLSSLVRGVIIYPDYIEIQYNYKKELPILTNPVKINSSILHGMVDRELPRSKFAFYPSYFSYYIMRVA